MPDRDVLVTVNLAEETITCNRPRVKNSWRVKWKCPEGYPFAVDFGWDTPFTEESYSADNNMPNQSDIGAKTIKAHAGQNGKPFRFKYSIAVFVPYDPNGPNESWPDGKVLIADPEIIIDP